MLRTVVVRHELLKETFKKVVRFNTARALSVECSRRRHRNNQPAFLKNSSKIQWKYNSLRFYASYPAHLKVTLPALSPTMDSGTIISWEKKEGDKLNEGDLLAEIETDKATMGFETPEEGYLAKIILPAGSKNVAIGKLVCIIVHNEADVAAFKDYKDEGGAEAPASAPAPSTAPGAAPPVPSPAAPKVPAATGDRVYASPLAKRKAEELHVPLQGKGSGLFDSITSRDLPAAGAAPSAVPSAAPSMGRTPSISFPSAARASPAAAAPAPGAFIDIPVTAMRATIAKRLVQSKQTIPHYYLTATCTIDKLMSTRARLNKSLEKQGVKISVNDFLIKALALASRKVPEANSIWMDSVIRQYANVDVSVAVSTDKGLITPIIFNADAKGLIAISKTMKELAAKARANKLQPQEFMGGTISISNLGMFGTDQFCAVVNPPQACILAVGTTSKKLVLDAKSEKGFKEITTMTVTLSCDHRVIDGAVGAQWLDTFRQNIEDPEYMLLL